MQLVRSVVGKVSQNMQCCRSIRNSQSRELCTSLRNNDGNSTKERGVSVLSELFRKGEGLAIEYGPCVALGGVLGLALPSFGWYAHAYAIADRDSEKYASELFNLKLKALKDRLDFFDVGDKYELVQVDSLCEHDRILEQKIVEQDEILKELFNQLSKLANHQA